MTKTIVFLDYDGVMCDSVKEAYLLSRYAYCNISPFEKIDEEEYLKFRKYRTTIINSWQYYYFFSDENRIYNDKTIDFNNKFLIMRKNLMDNHFDFWLSLEQMTNFAFLIKDLINCNKEKFCILSTKNKEAILKKLEYFNFDIKYENIYDKKSINDLTKGEFINKLNLEKALLIDDSIVNIQSCYQFNNIIPILTKWGYNSDNTIAKSEEEILKLIKDEL